MSIPPEIILSSHRALIGAIPKTLRGLTISYTDGALHWKAYFETHPTTEEQDALSTACTEIVADISTIKKVAEEYVYVPYPQPWNMLQEWLFLRWERE